MTMVGGGTANGGSTRRLAPWAGGLALVLGLAGCSGMMDDDAPPVVANSCANSQFCGNRVDGDHNNTISQSEWDSAFHGADTNGDGQVSRSEFEGAGGDWGGGHDGR
jgi:hypothetical protein